MTSPKSIITESRLNGLINKLNGLASALNGILQYQDPAANLLNVGHQTSNLTANAAQCSSSAQTGTGLSVPVASGTSYTFFADLYVSNQSTNSIYITMGGPSMTTFYSLIKYEALFAFAANDAENFTAAQTTIGVNTGLELVTTVNGQGYWVHLQGYCTPSANGNLVVAQASSANVASFTVQKGSQLVLLG